MFDIKRGPDESEEKFVWRICSAKDSGQLDLDWTEIADIINRECRADESEYRTASAYRKPYQQAKRFLEAGVFQAGNNETYIDELRIARQEVQQEKYKLQDERTALNKNLRAMARTSTDVDYLFKLVEERGFANLPPHEDVAIQSDNDLVICVSDLHIGETYNNAAGQYNSVIAAQRLQNYLERILEIQKTHGSENAYCILLGDIISGAIHNTTQLQNRENVIEQVQTAAELLSSFVYELSKHFKNVYVNSVAGNHSRIGLKENVLRDERLDDLIPWYMKAELQHIQNVKFITYKNVDATIGNLQIRGKQYYIVHGDYDTFDSAGISKLVMMLGYIPEAVFMGHLHRNSLDNASGVNVVRSGSLAGTGDDYTVSKRLYGQPGQMTCVVNKDGIVACYPIEFKACIRREENGKE